MINNEKFLERLQKVIQYYELTSSAFADKIGVQRSSISHLLSGRNKPSLDFILKILKEFPEVELYWLLNGKGSFPKNESELSVVETINQKSEKQATLPFNTPSNIKESDIQSIETNKPFANESEGIERIVVFYKNGTFKNYNP